MPSTWPRLPTRRRRLRRRTGPAWRRRHQGPGYPRHHSKDRRTRRVPGPPRPHADAEPFRLWHRRRRLWPHVAADRGSLVSTFSEADASQIGWVAGAGLEYRYGATSSLARSTCTTTSPRPRSPLSKASVRPGRRGSRSSAAVYATSSDRRPGSPGPPPPSAPAVAWARWRNTQAAADRRRSAAARACRLGQRRRQPEVASWRRSNLPYGRDRSRRMTAVQTGAR